MHDGFEGPDHAQFLSVIEEGAELIGLHGTSLELLAGFIALVQRGGPISAGAPLHITAELALVSSWVAFRSHFLELASASASLPRADPQQPQHVWVGASELQAALRPQLVLFKQL